jgi:hypothetical protein
MKTSWYWFLFIMGLLVALGVAALQDTPGYMDADYYFYGGLRLANGHGFTEMILWNYLDDPSGIPHPSHTYWMPLTSIISAIGIVLFRFLGNFKAAQVGFVLIFAAIPPLTAALSIKLTGVQNKAIFAGVLALFSGYFLPVSTTTESFGLYILLGGAFFLVVQKNFKRRLFVLGILAGLMHLTRADGILWLFLAMVALLMDWGIEIPDWRRRINLFLSWEFILRVGEILLGYFIIMAGWYIRNIVAFGSLFPAGGGLTLWLLHYDELFSYPAAQLTFERWWASGLGEILRVRVEALWLNLQSGIAVQGIIVLGPLALIGAWKYRALKTIRVGWIAWAMILGVMTILFPYSGVRGGFFHSGAAFMPTIWALAPVGLEGISNWTVKRFNWEVKKISPFLYGLVIVVVFLISFSQVFLKTLGTDFTTQAPWSQEARHYHSLEVHLREVGATSEDIVMVNNPPGYSLVSGRPAIVIPDGDVNTLMHVAQRYRPRYLLLEINHPRGLDELYQHPKNQPDLLYLDTVATTHIFLIGEVSD